MSILICIFLPSNMLLCIFTSFVVISIPTILHLVWYVSHTCQSRMLSPLSFPWVSHCPCSIGMFSQFSRVVLTTGQTTCGLLHAWILFMYSPCHSLFLFRTKFTCERGWTIRSDHVRTVAHLPRYYYTPTFFSSLIIIFLSSPGSHKVHVRTGLIFSSFIPIAQSSRANGVDILFLYTYSTKFTCERGWYLILFIPIAQSSRANGVDILFSHPYSTKFTCERGWYLIYFYL
jgi:hypothetical protein